MFIFNTETSTSDLVQTLPVVVETKPVFFQTTTNQFGETVTSSTSITQVVESIPQVKDIIKEIKDKYTTDVTDSSTVVVETEGTTVKEVKIVTKTDKQTETVFTGLVNGTVVKVIDVQIAPTPKPLPIVPVQGILPGEPCVKYPPADL